MRPHLARCNSGVGVCTFSALLHLLLSLSHTATALKMSASSSPPIGFIGLGIMGKGMAQNLLKKIDNCSLVVWNRSPEACAELAAAFPPGRVAIAASAADVVKTCEVTYSMLSTMEASEAVFDDPANGVISAVTAGKTLVDCATLSPARMVHIASEVEKRGGRFLEAPVSGSKVPAETGTLIFLCGGEASVFQAVSSGLDCMGKASFHLGPVGAGSKMKLVVNMVMGTMMSAFAEGMSLCDAAELPQDMLLQILDLGAMANPMFKGKGPNMINKTFSPHFPLKHAQKDMRLALELGKGLGVPLETTEAANEVFLQAMEQSHSDEDFSAVYTATQRK